MLAGENAKALVLLEGLEADGARVTGVPLSTVFPLGKSAYGPESDSSVGPSMYPKSTLPYTLKKGL